jgi:hypothetical protein
MKRAYSIDQSDPTLPPRSGMEGTWSDYGRLTQKMLGALVLSVSVQPYGKPRRWGWSVREHQRRFELIADGKARSLDEAQEMAEAAALVWLRRDLRGRIR